MTNHLSSLIGQAKAQRDAARERVKSFSKVIEEHQRALEKEHQKVEQLDAAFEALTKTAAQFTGEYQ